MIEKGERDVDFLSYYVALLEKSEIFHSKVFILQTVEPTLEPFIRNDCQNQILLIKYKSIYVAENGAIFTLLVFYVHLGESINACLSNETKSIKEYFI